MKGRFTETKINWQVNGEVTALTKVSGVVLCPKTIIHTPNDGLLMDSLEKEEEEEEEEQEEEQEEEEEVKKS